MRHQARVGILLGLLILSVAAPAAVQRGGGGGGGGSLDFGVPASQRSRLDILEAAFTLDGDQKDAVKTALDEAHKTAAPVRKELASTRGALSAAIMTGKDQAEVDQAVNAYAAQVTAMAGIEMKALAGVLRALRPEQQQNGAAVRTAFFLVRGMFLDDRRWNIIPEPRGY
jgi:Spy/CpxP family protein refolding chaperone